MLLFAHTGITAGCAWLAGKTASALNKNEPAASNEKLPLTYTGSAVSGVSKKPAGLTGFDYRMVIIGSMLPDILDKPLGIWLLADEISSGRIYGHTLVFLMVIVAAGITLYHFKRSAALLLVGAGTFTHLVLDQMWQNPRTLFWPMMGAEFERHETGEWLGGLFETLTSNPSVYVPEIIGALIVAAFAWNLIRGHNLVRFIKTGQLSK